METETEGLSKEEIDYAKEVARRPRGRPRAVHKVSPSEKQRKYIARLRLVYALNVAQRDGVDVPNVIRELYPILTGTLGSEAPA